nr:hypothetical protein [Pseudomonas sp. ANT_J12]
MSYMGREQAWGAALGAGVGAGVGMAAGASNLTKLLRVELDLPSA